MNHKRAISLAQNLLLDAGRNDWPLSLNTAVCVFGSSAVVRRSPAT
jgi:hypothetical protein